MKHFIVAVLLLTSGILSAQVVYTDPVFPVQDGEVTIFFDATQGNGELAGYSGEVFAHTGVITNESATDISWLHVQGTWGTYDESVLMSEVSENLFSITYNINDFYSVPAGDTVFRLAFVFRNEDGSLVGRNSDGSDIFTPVYEPGLNIAILYPDLQPFIIEPGELIDIQVASLDATSTELFVDGVSVATTTDDALTYTWSTSEEGLHQLVAIAMNGAEIVSDTTEVYVLGVVPVAALPDGVEQGINYINDSTVTLVLYAPFKNYIFAPGDYSDWEINESVLMNQTPDGETYWITLNNLEPGVEYAYQYLIDGTLKVADPLTEKVLDPWNDSFIPESVYPDLKPYPTGKTSGIVSVFQTATTPYEWAYPEFTPANNEDLIIYELLVRDFLADRSYHSLIDSLDYLQRLGVNAVQLMPVMEYEGNDSWGYNPSFFLALDKYYGTRETFKQFVDSCHSRGIAVILDIAMNHAFGQCPLVQMWWDGSAPAANSPYFNVVPKHDFNVGYDFNHDSPATIALRSKIFTYWLEAYNVDGYRFDLSKGYTQNNTLGDVGAWGAYDAVRIATWKSIADELWSVEPDALLILEHFAENAEEKELANYGFMIWGNMNYNYSEGAMGWGTASGNSSLYWASYQNRGWNDPHAIVYAESHDEERLMYKNITFGNASNPDHNCKDPYVALERMEQVAVFLMGIPGPKMIWQFGELGYDYSINYGCRVCPKPVRWDYLTQSARYRLYQVYSAMNALKTGYEAFASEDFVLNATGAQKRINLNNDDMNVTILGNFGVASEFIEPAFQHTGWWYEYFSGDSVEVTDVYADIFLAPGAYRLYTDVRLETPDIIVDLDDSEIPTLGNIAVYPNPTTNQFQIGFNLYQTSQVQVQMFNVQGQPVLNQTVSLPAGYHNLPVSTQALPAGMYQIALSGLPHSETFVLVKQ